MKPLQTTYRDDVTSWATQWFPAEVQPAACYIGQLLSELLGLPLSQIKATSRLTEDLEATELEPVEIAMALKDDFGVYLSDQEARQISTVADLVSYFHIRVL